jgi:hypothetical protein
MCEVPIKTFSFLSGVVYKKNAPTLWCLELYSDLNIHDAGTRFHTSGLHEVGTDITCTPNVTPTLVSRRRRDLCVVTIARRCQLPSHRRLLPIWLRNDLQYLPLRSLWTPYKAAGWETTCSRWLCEVFGHLPQNDLQQMPMWSKLSPLGHRYLTPIYCMPGCMRWDIL